MVCPYPHSYAPWLPATHTAYVRRNLHPPTLPSPPLTLTLTFTLTLTLTPTLTLALTRYRSKQHVHRLYLTGSNSATQPWRLPLLPPELRSLMSETQYYMISG